MNVNVHNNDEEEELGLHKLPAPQQHVMPTIQWQLFSVSQSHNAQQPAPDSPFSLFLNCKLWFLENSLFDRETEAAESSVNMQSLDCGAEGDTVKPS